MSYAKYIAICSFGQTCKKKCALYSPYNAEVETNYTGCTVVHVTRQRCISADCVVDGDRWMSQSVTHGTTVRVTRGTC
jgi:hypothetical protein